EDWEQADWGVRRRLPIPALARVGHGHLDARLVRPWIDDAIWHGYVKAVFVRDPWDRFVSAAFARNARRPLFLRKPEAYLELMLQHQATMEHECFWPQHRFVDDEHGRMVTTFVGRFENLQADVRRFCGLVGLPAIELPHLNHAPYRDATFVCGAALHDRIARHYARDIEIFDYPRRPDPDGGGAARGDQ